MLISNGMWLLTNHILETRIWIKVVTKSNSPNQIKKTNVEDSEIMHFPANLSSLSLELRDKRSRNGLLNIGVPFVGTHSSLINKELRELRVISRISREIKDNCLSVFNLIWLSLKSVHLIKIKLSIFSFIILINVLIIPKLS